LARVPKSRSNGRSNPGSTGWEFGLEPRREAAEEDVSVVAGKSFRMGLFPQPGPVRG